MIRCSGRCVEVCSDVVVSWSKSFISNPSQMEVFHANSYHDCLLLRLQELALFPIAVFGCLGAISGLSVLYFGSGDKHVLPIYCWPA